MTTDAMTPGYRTCEFCGNETPKTNIACWKCGLWKGRKYETKSEAPLSSKTVTPREHTENRGLLVSSNTGLHGPPRPG